MSSSQGKGTPSRSTAMQAIQIKKSPDSPGCFRGTVSQRNRFALALARFTPTHFPFVKLN
jgi:hypothetical protein